MLITPILMLQLFILLWPRDAPANSPCPSAEESLAILGQPERYEMQHGCITVTGVSAGQVIETNDGEAHTFVVIDPEWRSTFSPDATPGEDVIIDTEMHTYGDYSIFPAAWVGQRVSVTGALVYDKLRGYGRINPVWNIE